MKKLISKVSAVFVLLIMLIAGGCHSVDDDRIPAMPVNISLANPGLWNTYGVSGFGMFRYFILPLREPAGFSYTAQSATGFGGVLLINGMDPLAVQTDVPLAYDLACPVERQAEIRVRVDASTFEAICPKCGSHYDVTMQGGAPLSGPAAAGKHKYGLTRYTCYQTQTGGYVITR